MIHQDFEECFIIVLHYVLKLIKLSTEIFRICSKELLIWELDYTRPCMFYTVDSASGQ